MKKKFLLSLAIVIVLITSFPSFMTTPNQNLTVEINPTYKDITNTVKGDTIDVVNTYLEYQKNALLSRHVSTNIFQDIIFNDKLRIYQKELLEFLIISQNQDNTNIISYDYNINKIDISLKDSLVNANVIIEKNIQYNFLNEPTQIIDEYTFSLEYINGTLGIRDLISSEEISKVYGKDTNFTILKKDAKSNYDKLKDQSIVDTKKDEIAFETFSIASNFVSYSTTNRSNAAAYSSSYTNNSGQYDDVNYNKSQFKVYGTDDCQNYVSQCIWYGFGGRSSTNLDFPMNGVWWANLGGETTTWNWTSASAFKTYITGNYNGNKYGIQGIEYTSPSNILQGDYVYVPGHVMFINSVTGASSWSNIYISAHTRNRLNVNLKALYGGISAPPADMKFIKIYGCLQP